MITYMRYPLYNKYAMPMDSKVLESERYSEGLDIIPYLLSLLKKVNLKNFSTYESEIRELTNKLWYLNFDKGISLRDREVLLPVFKEYSRILKPYEETPSVIYRGVSLPNIYKKAITNTFGSTDRLIKPNENHKVKDILENLAYGLRSWTKDKTNAYGYASKEDDDLKDGVVYIYKQPKVIFDCDAYFSFTKTMDNWSSITDPFDRKEIISYVENPKIVGIKRSYYKDDFEASPGDASIWEVEIIF